MKLSTPYFRDVYAQIHSAAGVAIDSVVFKTEPNKRYKILLAFVEMYKTTGTRVILDVEPRQGQAMGIGTGADTSIPAAYLVDTIFGDTNDFVIFPNDDVINESNNVPSNTEIFLISDDRVRVRVALTVGEVIDIVVWLRMLCWDEIGQ